MARGLLGSDRDMREWWRYLRVTYLTADARSLGVFRLVFGLVLGGLMGESTGDPV